MLHIILVILKLIGILLAAVLLLLLLLCLILLFVPLRYELWGKRYPEILEGSVKIRWLMGLAGARLSFENGAPKAGIRFLWLSKQLFPREPEKEKKEKSPKKKRTEEIPQGSPQKESGESVKGEEIHWEEEPRTEQREEFSSASEPPKPRKEEDGEVRRSPCFLRKLWDRMRDLFIRLIELPGKLWKKFAALGKGIRNAKRSLTEWMELLTGELVRGLLRRYQGFLLTLLRHIRPRKARGSLHFGFEDPSLTGIFTGFLYLALPAGSGKIEMLPDFKECVLEGELSLKGHVRFCHLAWIGWKVFRDKELRTLIKRVRA